MSNVLLFGLHRGGRTIAQELKPATTRLYEPGWLLADRKAGRAEQMSALLREKYPMLEPRPLTLRAQDALAFSRDHDTLILSVDTIEDTSTTLEARRPSQRAHFQICGKGPSSASGTLIAIQGTLCPGDKQSESVSLLLSTLEGMSRAASSRELTRPDPVAAAVLQPLRTVISRRTVTHMGEKEREPRDLTGSPLSLAFGQTLLPLIAVEGRAQDKFSQQQALALESAGVFAGSSVTKVGLPALMVVVALVIPHARTVHFMRVALTRTGKRSVAGVTTFALPRVTQRSSNNAALFTD